MKPIDELTGRRRRFLNGFRLAGELDFGERKTGVGWVQDVLEHRRAAEGRLGIDHPIGLADRRQVLSEGRGLLTTASNAAVIRHDRIPSWGRRGLFLYYVLTGEEFPCVCCCRQSGLVATSSQWWRWHCS